MAHNAAYTKVYVDTANSIGLGVHEVTKCLGRNTLDVGTLCGDTGVVKDGEVVDAGGKINKWAKHKPVRFPGKMSPLSDADLASVDYGFDTSTGAGISERGGAAALASLISTIIANNGATWNYLPPRGMNHPFQGYHEWFRLLDFDGYNHAAKAPFRVPSTGITIPGGPVTGYRDSVVKETTDVEIDITLMRTFLMPDTESGDMNLACVVRNAGITRLFILENSDPFANSNEVSIPINLLDGVNYCQFIYTDFDPSEVDANGNISAEAGEGYNFVALPNCFQVFTVSAIVSSLLMNAGWAQNGAEYFFRIVVDSHGYVNTITPRVVYYNNTGDDVYCQVHAAFRYNEDVVLQSDSASILASTDPEDNHIEMSSVNVGDFVGGSDFETADLDNVEIKLWWTWGSQGGNRRYFNFNTNQIVATDPGYAPLERYYTVEQ